MKNTRLVTADEIASRFGVTVGTVNRWVRDGAIPYLRPSRRVVRFDLETVERALAERAIEAGPAAKLVLRRAVEAEETP